MTSSYEGVIKDKVLPRRIPGIITDPDTLALALHSQVKDISDEGEVVC